MDKKIERMFTEGCTALGPALAISAGMVAASPMSEVVLCTDGEPNVGVGNLEYEQGKDFYKKVFMSFVLLFLQCDGLKDRSFAYHG